jgi:hypothetical protein
MDQQQQDMSAKHGCWGLAAWQHSSWRCKLQRQQLQLLKLASSRKTKSPPV